jgi:uncharacterized membrane protein YfcA
MDLSLPALALIAAASAAAGAVNALAGGGTLIAFPALTVVGVPPVEANIATTIGLNAGYLGGSVAQRDDLAGQHRRILALAPAAVAGGLTGAYLLSVTTEDLFRLIIPWLIFAACGLLAVQPRVRAALEQRRARPGLRGPNAETGAPPPDRGHGVGPVLVAATYLGAIYGGYFGAGLGIVFLAVLGVVLDDDLRRVNALKQILSLTINLSAAALLLFSGRVVWAAVAVVAAGSLVGGTLGGRLAGRLDPAVLRRTVIAIGVVVGLVYLVKR